MASITCPKITHVIGTNLPLKFWKIPTLRSCRSRLRNIHKRHGGLGIQSWICRRPRQLGLSYQLGKRRCMNLWQKLKKNNPRRSGCCHLKAATGCCHSCHRCCHRVPPKLPPSAKQVTIHKLKSLRYTMITRHVTAYIIFIGGFCYGYSLSPDSRTRARS